MSHIVKCFHSFISLEFIGQGHISIRKKMHFAKASVSSLPSFWDWHQILVGKNRVLKCQLHGINDEILMGFKGDRLSCNALDRVQPDATKMEGNYP